MEELGRLRADVDLPAEPDSGWRFHHHENGFYDLGSAIVLYGVIRHVSPGRIVEIGSGFSSALMLDVNERYLNWAIECTFIDPFPENRLLKLLHHGDRDRVRIIPHFLQDVDPGLFDCLEQGDILFIDSSHVAKLGSDVNLLLSEIIPRLPTGAWVHVHDIFYPFEYPPEWVEKWIKEGRAWNEAYHLRAFLEHNNAFQICFFSDYLRRFQGEALEQALPSSIASPTGLIWLKRVT